MTILKSDIEKKLTEKEEQEFKELEKSIDEFLYENYVGNFLLYYPDKPINLKLQRKIVDKYSAAGWKVRFGTHMDGIFVIFS